MQDLQGDPVAGLVLGEVDDALAAFTEPLDQPVAADALGIAGGQRLAGGHAPVP